MVGYNHFKMRALYRKSKQIQEENFLKDIDKLCNNVRITKGLMRAGDHSLMIKERMASYTSKLTSS